MTIEKVKRPRGRPPGKKRRDPNGITLAEITERSGVSHVTVIKWQSGAKISEGSKQQIDHALGVIARERLAFHMDSVHRKWRENRGIKITEDGEAEREDSAVRGTVDSTGMRCDGKDAGPTVTIEGEVYRYDSDDAVASLNAIRIARSRKLFEETFEKYGPRASALGVRVGFPRSGAER